MIALSCRLLIWKEILFEGSASCPLVGVSSFLRAIGDVCCLLHDLFSEMSEKGHGKTPESQIETARFLRGGVIRSVETCC